MKNILTEALVNSATNASFIFSYTNSAKLRLNDWLYASFSFKNGGVSVYSKKDEKKSKKHLTKEEVFGNIDEHC